MEQSNPRFPIGGIFDGEPEEESKKEHGNSNSLKFILPTIGIEPLKTRHDMTQLDLIIPP